MTAVVRDMGAADDIESIVSPRTPDEDLAAACRQIEAVLRMAVDMARDGAVLRIKRPVAIARAADIKGLWASAINRMVVEILDHTVVVEPENADADS